MGDRRSGFPCCMGPGSSLKATVKASWGSPTPVAPCISLFHFSHGQRGALFGGVGEGVRAWPHHAILALRGSDSLLDVEDVTAGPDQHGGARVQDGLAAAVTGHHHAIDSDAAEGDRMALQCPLLGSLGRADSQFLGPLLGVPTTS